LRFKHQQNSILAAMSNCPCEDASLELRSQLAQILGKDVAPHRQYS